MVFFKFFFVFLVFYLGVGHSAEGRIGGRRYREGRRHVRRHHGHAGLLQCAPEVLRAVTSRSSHCARSENESGGDSYGGRRRGGRRRRLAAVPIF